MDWTHTTEAHDGFKAYMMKGLSRFILPLAGMNQLNGRGERGNEKLWTADESFSENAFLIL